MIKPSFDIIELETTSEQLVENQLVIEVSELMLSYIYFNPTALKLIAFRSYTIESQPEKPSVEVIAEIIASDDWLQGRAVQTSIVYAYPESSLVPDELFVDGIQKNITELVYGTVNRGVVLAEPIANWNIQNVYRVPREINGLINQHFPDASHKHMYSAWIQSITERLDAIYIRFYPDQLTVMLFKDEQLQIIQSFSYQTPEDVVYFVLALAKQSGMNPLETPLFVEGLIDEQSSLFAEIRKYFIDIRLRKPSANFSLGEVLAEYPHHYFTPILNLALCV